MSDEIENQEGGLGRPLSRRDLIKRGAIVGGAVVWATPVVDSLVSRAATASLAPCGCSPSTDNIVIEAIPTGFPGQFKFLARQHLPDSNGGSCATVCTGNCPNHTQGASTNYVWDFDGAPGSVPSNVTETTPPSGVPNPAYTMGSAIPAVNCPLGATFPDNPLSELTLTFSSDPGTDWGVIFITNVQCNNPPKHPCSQQAQQGA